VGARFEPSQGLDRCRLADALASMREGWEGETTARNLRPIRETREGRGEAVAGAETIEQALLK
jgi:hypothetical protein